MDELKRFVSSLGHDQLVRDVAWRGAQAQVSFEFVKMKIRVDKPHESLDFFAQRLQAATDRRLNLSKHMKYDYDGYVGYRYKSAACCP